jgi:ergothioneine biosynthesis protein EgtB
MNSNSETIAVSDTKRIYEDRNLLAEKYKAVRKFFAALCEPLKTEDYVIQSMPDVSPAKWHLAHTSWFFEAFVLKNALKNYRSLHPQYNFLFNSYYTQIGERFTRAIRGLLSRPTVEEVYNYRNYVDKNVVEFIENCTDKQFREFGPVIEIGIHHEQQHQELFLTDIKHVFSLNPLRPVYADIYPPIVNYVPELIFRKYGEGIYEAGHTGNDFGFDNEFPRHKVYLNSFQIANRLATNREYIDFIEDGGYKKPELWLSDGFAVSQKEDWQAPMYWEKIDDEWWNFKLTGFHVVDLNEPVCHISYYEADAYARWAGCRLPTEFEWEKAAEKYPVEGNFVENGYFHPIAVPESPIIHQPSAINHQMFGDVWQWTMSPYIPYPGYKTLPGALGEYNGKFMSNQLVLRGGSCATSVTHIRRSYRNFFYPHSRWQFMGLRLAKDNE